MKCEDAETFVMRRGIPSKEIFGVEKGDEAAAVAYRERKVET